MTSKTGKIIVQSLSVVVGLFGLIVALFVSTIGIESIWRGDFQGVSFICVGLLLGVFLIYVSYVCLKSYSLRAIKLLCASIMLFASGNIIRWVNSSEVVREISSSADSAIISVLVLPFLYVIYRLSVKLLASISLQTANEN